MKHLYQVLRKSKYIKYDTKLLRSTHNPIFSYLPKHTFTFNNFSSALSSLDSTSAASVNHINTKLIKTIEPLHDNTHMEEISNELDKNVLYPKGLNSRKDSNLDKTSSTNQNNIPDQLENNQGNGNGDSNNQKPSSFKDNTTFIIALLGAVLGVWTTWQSYKNNQNLVADKKKAELEQDILNIEKDLVTISKAYTRDHATYDGIKQGHTALDLINGILDKVIGTNADSEIKEYFEGKTKIANKKVSLATLLYLSYACNIWSTQDMHSSQKGKKSLEKLNAVEQMIKHYLKNNNIEINLDQLAKEKDYNEINNQLNKFDNLLELYTVSTYLKGRTYIYENDYEGAMPYFELARDLSKNTQMFEHHLSQRNGIGYVNDQRIERALNDGRKAEAKEIIESNIAMYNDLMNSLTHYKMNYRPINTANDTDPQAFSNYEDCVPKSDRVNIIECSKRLIKYQAWRIDIIDNKEEADEVLKSFECLIKGDKDHCSIIDVLENKMDKNVHLSDRHRASGYNHLGKALTKLVSHNIDIQDLCNVVANRFSINKPEGDDKISISIIKFIFNKAKELSSNTDYTRANAEDGLAKIELFEIQTKLEQEKDSPILETYCDQIQSVVQHLQARNVINDSLSRKESYLDGKICSELNELMRTLFSIETVDQNSDKYIELKEMVGETCSRGDNDFE